MCSPVVMDMDASFSAVIDELAANTTFQDWDDITFINIPNVSKLTELERNAVVVRARSRQLTTPFFADALESKLLCVQAQETNRCITPPLDEEEEEAESRELEAQARKTLESEGCPPCYPTSLKDPIKSPGKYQSIIKYWTSFPGTDGVVLCAQLSDWRRFRRFQAWVRTRYPGEFFAKYKDEVCERRRSNGISNEDDNDVCLLWEFGEQSRLENWTEFQNYHLKNLERFRSKRDSLREELNDIQWGADVSEYAMESAKAIRQQLESINRDLARNNILLEWIEQERQAMSHDQYHNTTPKVSLRSPVYDHGSTQKTILGVLGIAKVAKTSRPTVKRSHALKREVKVPPPGTRIHSTSQTRLRSGRISRPPRRWAPE